MSILFINAAFRKNSRTKKIADGYLANCTGDITEVKLGSLDIKPLNEESLKIYNESVAAHNFDNPMFDVAKQFVEADEIVIAAPFWNFSIPAVLHNYLELVCTQGISFDMSGEGTYYSLCKAKKLTFITTAGGNIPEQNCAFDYIKSLCNVFWNIEEVKYIKAECLDVYGVDVDEKINKLLEG